MIEIYKHFKVYDKETITRTFKFWWKHDDIFFAFFRLLILSCANFHRNKNMKKFSYLLSTSARWKPALKENLPLIRILTETFFLHNFQIELSILSV